MVLFDTGGSGGIGSGTVLAVARSAAGGVSGQGNYSATKAGLLGLSGTLAKEYGIINGQELRVNSGLDWAP